MENNPSHCLNKIMASKKLNVKKLKQAEQSFAWLIKEVHQLMCQKGWHPATLSEPERISNYTANVHGEVSEFWEAHRTGVLDRPCDKAEKMIKAGISPLTCREEEMADKVIRIFDEAGRSNVRLFRAIFLKHAYNATRPWRHGNKKA